MKHLLFVLITFVHVFSGPIEDLKPGHWYEVPNSHLEDYKVNLAAMTNVLQLPTGANNFSAIMENWCGGTIDTKRSQLLIWGGGHGSYAGNEVYGFDIPTLTWVRLTDPSPILNWCSGEVNPDGQPTARHTYGSMTYVEHIDHMYGSGASVSCSRGGARALHNFTLDLTTKEWIDHDKTMSGTPHEGGAEQNSVYNPLDSCVYFHTNMGGWYVMDFERNQLRRANTVGASFEHSVVLDTKRNKIYELGTKTSGGGDPTRFKIIDLDSPALTVTDVATSGDQTGINTRNPGAAYHPLSDQVVVWRGGTPIYTLNLTTRVWTKQPLPATNTVVPSANTATGGIYGRFGYVPAYDVFVAVNSTDEPVYIYKLDPGTAGQKVASPGGFHNVSVSALPNPFHSSTTITIKGPAVRELKIFDMTGKLATALSNSARAKHNSHFVWNTRNLPAGIYFVRLRAGNTQMTKRLFLMK